MRRLVLEDPFARSAIWSRNLAVFALVVALIGILLSRKGLDPQASLAIIGGALALAGLAVLCAIVAMGVIWHTGFRGIGRAVGGLFLSALLFAYPAYLAVQARTVSSLADVSTSYDDPPTFMTSEAARSARKGVMPPLRQSEADHTLQDNLYPDLQTLTLDSDAETVVEAIRKLVKRHRWKIIGEVEPANFATGHIDVVATSAVMGFPVDITFRIRELGNQTQVDVRAVSRAGWQEQPGANAARVDDLVNALSDAIGSS